MVPEDAQTIVVYGRQRREVLQQQVLVLLRQQLVREEDLLDRDYQIDDHLFLFRTPRTPWRLKTRF